MKVLRGDGFTIVELLVVIVVIGILAAISIVAYSTVKARADDASIKSDLVTNRKKLLELRAVNGSFPRYFSGMRSKDCGVPPGTTNASGDYCPITSNGAATSTDFSSDGQTFTFLLGKGTYAHTITDDGFVSKIQCTENTSQPPADGYTMVYQCPSGLMYSQ
jgi:prepilin-type N-terminal cleavage/methylation domain-containing protein